MGDPAMADDAWSLLEGRVTQAMTTADEVLNTLPADSPPTWRDIAYKEMIGAVLRDWTTNGTKELVEEDTSNLTGFLKVAVSAAGRAKTSRTLGHGATVGAGGAAPGIEAGWLKSGRQGVRCAPSGPLTASPWVLSSRERGATECILDALPAVATL